MTPDQLVASSFDGYPAAARRFAVEHLSLLQRLPLVVCPSFLQQIQNLDTSFPAEKESLRWQCDSLQKLAPERYSALASPLAALSIPPSLQSLDWVHSPASFIPELTAYLWSSGQINQFRLAASALFASVPSREDTTHRLVFVMLGQGAQVESGKVLRKLSKQGVFFSSLKTDTAFQDIRRAIESHASKASAPYANWYVDGSVISDEIANKLPNTTAVSYTGLSKLRERVLERMQVALPSSSGGAEQIHTRLIGTSWRDVGASEITSDPVLQRFYTELFTESSGPQIFSTSFVQWAGRELIRRAQPQTLLLRYTPRQSHREMSEMFASVTPSSFDPQGSFRDAEMGAYYNWIEMNRIAAPGKLTFMAWVENKPFAVIVGAGTPAGTICATPMSITEALQNFG
ncbi:hypothetical protein [Granulicella mallensis]|uniref:Uncharacterized protein n=1 Tax=Granulicella mallensis (strain ATCC BAA-1857 / DSM 23137 / MP5ACTX8) TaxID=682795 RepID=G8NWF5_GRAMM|nr:hypothetical protein [Granulicella mallensis]AEU37758.1 hypothetical protein AciX8_3461 [Granulicella mallensis MP5ACTX8]